MTSLEHYTQLLSNPKTIEQELSRRNLEDFIRYTFPDYDFGWFNEELAEKLTQFVQDVQDGKQPRLMIFAPPRSGKSEQVSRRLPAWALGKYPDMSIIAASYSDGLASRMNKDVQRIIDSDLYFDVFPNTTLSGRREKSSDYARNNKIFEIVGHKGSYKSAGVLNGITGMGADIGIIDDPVKDALQANSKTFRDSVWEWYTSTFYTRLSPKSGILLCMTRWHEDDLAGRLLKAAEEDNGDKWVVIDYPAIATKDEKHRKKGEALHPSRYPLKHLLKIMKAVGSRVWNALYQGSPIAQTGSIFKTDKLTIVDAIPAGVIIRKVRGWDLAATKDDGDYTAGVLVGEGSDGRFYVLDVVRGQYSSLEVEEIIKATASRDGYNVDVHLPQDPAAAGKSWAQRLVSLLAGFTAKAERMAGDKILRSSAWAAQMEAGNVVLLRGPWNTAFIEEYRDFPYGKNDDQVDGGADAFNEIAVGGTSMFDV